MGLFLAKYYIHMESPAVKINIPYTVVYKNEEPMECLQLKPYEDSLGPEVLLEESPIN